MTDKALEILHELEHEYGSVDNAHLRATDKRLKVLRNELDGTHKIRHASHSQIVKSIIPLRDKGFSYHDIAQTLGFSVSKVRMIMRDSGTKLLPVYKYSVTSDDGTVMYCTTYKQIIKATGVKQQLISGLLDFDGFYHKGYKYEYIDPISVGLPPEVLVQKNGKWIRAKNL